MAVLWCQGMFASGSTWLYNAALAVAAALEPRRSVQGRFVFDDHDISGLDASPRGPAIQHIVKAHQAKGEVRAIAADADAIIVTVRDPRDAVVSLMQYQNFSFYRALFNVRVAAEACVLLGASPRAITLHYERGFIDDPATLDGLAACLGGAIPPARRAAIFQQTRRQAVEAFIAGLAQQPDTIVDRDGDMYDRASHWHRHHAGRTGEVGRFRRFLYPAQIQGIEGTLGDWMACFGYGTR
ncbi:hypothetical protein [Lichenicoccus sp.]|uniref:hypothetical protein n=1 Tax=Lichenicoccus sp. TaxID=2781899 RepID=UPI003D0B4151